MDIKCDKTPEDCCHRGKKPNCFQTFYWLCKEFRQDQIGGEDEDVLVLQKAPIRYLGRDTTSTLPVAES